MAAGDAEAGRIVGGHQPVADTVLGVIAEPVRRLRLGQRFEIAIFKRFDRGNFIKRSNVAKRAATVLACDVFEIDELRAGLAGEDLHAVIVPCEGWRVCVEGNIGGSAGVAGKYKGKLALPYFDCGRMA
jgi:hypothetical protein